jgi:hypothetical protein
MCVDDRTLLTHIHFWFIVLKDKKANFLGHSAFVFLFHRWQDRKSEIY